MLQFVTRLGKDYKPGPRQRIEQVARRAVRANIDAIRRDPDKKRTAIFSGSADVKIISQLGDIAHASLASLAICSWRQIDQRIVKQPGCSPEKQQCSGTGEQD